MAAAGATDPPAGGKAQWTSGRRPLSDSWTLPVATPCHVPGCLHPPHCPFTPSFALPPPIAFLSLALHWRMPTLLPFQTTWRHCSGAPKSSWLPLRRRSHAPPNLPRPPVPTSLAPADPPQRRRCLSQARSSRPSVWRVLALVCRSCPSTRAPCTLPEAGCLEAGRSARTSQATWSERQWQLPPLGLARAAWVIGCLAGACPSALCYAQRYCGARRRGTAAHAGSTAVLHDVYSVCTPVDARATVLPRPRSLAVSLWVLPCLLPVLYRSRNWRRPTGSSLCTWRTYPKGRPTIKVCCPVLTHRPWAVHRTCVSAHRFVVPWMSRTIAFTPSAPASRWPASPTTFIWDSGGKSWQRFWKNGL